MKLSKFLIFAEEHNPTNFNSNKFTKEDILRYFGARMAKEIKEKYPRLRPSDENVIITDLIDRENLITTGIGWGVAIPHAKTKGTPALCLGVYYFPTGFDWKSMDDRPVYLAFPVIAPEDAIGAHHTVMANISYLAKNLEFCEGIKEIMKNKPISIEDLENRLDKIEEIITA